MTVIETTTLIEFSRGHRSAAIRIYDGGDEFQPATRHIRVQRNPAQNDHDFWNYVMVVAGINQEEAR
jgi:hypothetical protein